MSNGIIVNPPVSDEFPSIATDTVGTTEFEQITLTFASFFHGVSCEVEH
jgi:hypothetical protein